MHGEPEGELGAGWVTTVEQTLLDVAWRPDLGGLAEADAEEVIGLLVRRADIDQVSRLAYAQRKAAALHRLAIDA